MFIYHVLYIVFVYYMATNYSFSSVCNRQPLNTYIDQHRFNITTIRNNI